MTTPNVEELITYLQGLANEIEIPYPMEVIEEAAEVLQSQAERIAELERESETHAKAYGLAIVERDNLRHELKTAQEGWRCECSTDDACRFARERDALRAQLAEIAATEPVAWQHVVDQYSVITTHQKESNEFQYSEEFLGDHTIPLFTRPMPAQDVTELVEALQLFADALPLERSTVKTCYAVTNQMRDAAHTALSKYKGAK